VPVILVFAEAEEELAWRKQGMEREQHRIEQSCMQEWLGNRPVWCVKKKRFLLVL